MARLTSGSFRSAWLLALAACTARPEPPQAPDRNAVQAEVLAAEERFRAAMLTADTAALGALLAEEYLSTSAVGHISSRSESLLAYGARLVQVDSAAVREMTVRAYGGTAVVLGLLDWGGTAAGQPFAATARFQHVWVRQPDGRWLLVASQMTGQPARGSGRP